MAQWILSFVLPFKQNEFYSKLYSNKSSLFSSYNLTIYCQMISWLITIIIRYYFKNVYYKRLRILGYNNHHDKIKKHFLFPGFIFYHSNALLLVSTVIFNSFESNIISIKNLNIKSIYSAETIISIASFLILVNNVIHFYHELKFRRFRNPPDVFCVDDPTNRLTSDGLNQVAIR